MMVLFNGVKKSVVKIINNPKKIFKTKKVTSNILPFGNVYQRVENKTISVVKR